MSAIPPTYAPPLPLGRAGRRRRRPPITVAFADPPYPGKARKHYRRAEVDHAELVRYLEWTFPDGWALSTNASTLKQVLAVCPDDVRVAAWVKPFCHWKRGVRPAYAWEPLLFKGGRQDDMSGRTPRDWVACNIATKTGLVGAKPEAFCFWLFDVLGLAAGDTLVDLYPGTGAVTRAWERWTAGGPAR